MSSTITERTYNMFKTKIQEALQNTDLTVNGEFHALHFRHVNIKMHDGSYLCACHFVNFKNSNKIKITIYPSLSKLSNPSFIISNGFDSAEFTEKFSKRISTIYEKTKQEIQCVGKLV